ncbi:MAG: NAD-dependent DNA ligase [Selenomonadaceae bacterium]
MSDIVLKLRNAAQLINEVADELDKAPEEPKAKIEFTTVRAVLAQKAATGFKAEVKALLGKFNAEKLSDIRPEDYEQLMNEAEGIGNG